jgi:hypothetical protein
MESIQVAKNFTDPWLQIDLPTWPTRSSDLDDQVIQKNKFIKPVF